ncbi:CoA transferase [Sedimentitalea sp.]|uniref:CaiB/BaiF CoA transferase family protein n=1 Tax=Sedimentitalea sp. TaxID=2048915 RepID=UPI003298CC69
MAEILEGIRVLDFGRYIAGPFCAALLADFGAEVIRIEPPEGADDRYLMPISEDGEGALFLQSNRGKKSLTLDMSTDAGRALQDQLVATADVVIANMPAGALEKVGLDYDRLKAIKPDIILTVATAWGMNGKNRKAGGFDGTGQAISGAMLLSGNPGEPYRAATSYVDYSTAISCAFGTLAAIIRKMKSGEGSLVETSLIGTALTMTTPMLMEEATGARSRVATGNRSPIAGPSDLFAASDGWVLAQVIGQSMFRRWAKLMDRQDLIENPKFATDILRGENGAELSRIMAEWCGSRSVQNCLELLQNARIPVTQLLSPTQILEPERGLSEAFLNWMQGPSSTSPLPVARPVAEVSGMDPSQARPAPVLGADTFETLQGLGLSKDEVAELRSIGVV